jgi:hypothetical protein
VSAAERVRAFLHGRTAAYRAVFATPAGAQVLADLARFCRMTTSTYDPTRPPEAMHHLEGRREVFLRIAQHLHLDASEIYQLTERDRT